jgi:hypothetical protein
VITVHDTDALFEQGRSRVSLFWCLVPGHSRRDGFLEWQSPEPRLNQYLIGHDAALIGQHVGDDAALRGYLTESCQHLAKRNLSDRHCVQNARKGELLDTVLRQIDGRVKREPRRTEPASQMNSYGFPVQIKIQNFVAVGVLPALVKTPTSRIDRCTSKRGDAQWVFDVRVPRQDNKSTTLELDSQEI